MFIGYEISGKSKNAYAVFNALKELGYNVEISMASPDIGRRKGRPLIIVEDYNHSDCDGNPYSYTFDPVSGREIFD